MSVVELSNAFQAIGHTGNADLEVEIIDQRAKNDEGVSKIVFREIESIKIEEGKVALRLKEIED